MEITLPSAKLNSKGEPLLSEESIRGKAGEQVFVTEEMVDTAFDEQVIGEQLKVADQKRSQLSKEEFHRLRALCKRDLFFLCFSILGNKRLSTGLHGHLCTHIYDNRFRRFREYLLPRGHFKSTIVTIGHAIQVVLPYTDEDKAYDLDTTEIGWPYSLGTDCRLLIGHETAESASRFLFAITRHFTTNPLLLTLFPDAVPDKRRNRINKWELELPRSAAATGNPEPTIDTLGVGAKSQGRHYNYIKLDDIFGDKARDSVAENETTRDWFDGIQSFFSTFSKDHLDLIGTRYSLDDIYEHAHDRYEDKLVKYCRRIEEPWPDATGVPYLDRDGKIAKVPIFPEEFDPEQLDILRKNRKRFSAEYENDPDDGVSGFRPEWKRYFYWTGLNEIAVFNKDGQRTRINVRDLDICILIDPGARAKSGGFAVTGMDYLGRVYTLVALRIELQAPDLTEMVFRNVIRWQPRTVAFEADVFASVYEYWWYTEMKMRGVKFDVTPVHTNNRAKDDRIMGLSHYMVADKLFINDTQQELEDEWKRVGKSRNVHIFDALAYGPEVWRFGYAPGQREIINTPTATQSLEGQDPETGYSVIKDGTTDSATSLNDDGYTYGVH